MQSEKTLRAIDVYGQIYLIDRQTYENSTRTQIPLYTKSGQRLSEYHEKMGWSGLGKCTTIHRENIAQIKEA